jgi:NCAIR mutase (PurE)-related protein
LEERQSRLEAAQTADVCAARDAADVVQADVERRLQGLSNTATHLGMRLDTAEQNFSGCLEATEHELKAELGKRLDRITRSVARLWYKHRALADQVSPEHFAEIKAVMARAFADETARLVARFSGKAPPKKKGWFQRWIGG